MRGEEQSGVIEVLEEEVTQALEGAEDGHGVTLTIEGIGVRRGGTSCVHTLSPSCPRRHLGFAPDMVTCPLLRGQQESADSVSQTCRAGEGQGGSPWKPTEASQVHIDWWLDRLPGPCAPSPLGCFCCTQRALF